MPLSNIGLTPLNLLKFILTDQTPRNLLNFFKRISDCPPNCNGYQTIPPFFNRILDWGCGHEGPPKVNKKVLEIFQDQIRGLRLRGRVGTAGGGVSLHTYFLLNGSFQYLSFFSVNSCYLPISHSPLTSFLSPPSPSPYFPFSVDSQFISLRNRDILSGSVDIDRPVTFVPSYLADSPSYLLPSYPSLSSSFYLRFAPLFFITSIHLIHHPSTSLLPSLSLFKTEVKQFTQLFNTPNI